MLQKFNNSLYKRIPFSNKTKDLIFRNRLHSFLLKKNAYKLSKPQYNYGN